MPRLRNRIVALVNVPFVNAEPDFRLEVGDDAVVVAEPLGTLAPLQPDVAT